MSASASSVADEGSRLLLLDNSIPPYLLGDAFADRSCILHEKTKVDVRDVETIFTFAFRNLHQTSDILRRISTALPREIEEFGVCIALAEEKKLGTQSKPFLFEHFTFVRRSTLLAPCCAPTPASRAHCTTLCAPKLTSQARL